MKLKNGSEIKIGNNTKEKLRGTHTFQEVHDYLIKTGQIPSDDHVFLYHANSKNMELLEKVLMSNLHQKKNSMIITSTPNQNKKGYFWKMMNESKFLDWNKKTDKQQSS